MSSKKTANEFLKLANGFYWLKLAVPNLRILGGVPPDATKYLAKENLISSYKIDGYYTEHGPNMLILNEDLFVNGMIANLSEFPVLQMFYMQGMGLSFHPNFGKERPLIVGMEDQVKNQSNYINYGNNGMNFAEMMNSGADEKFKELYYYWYYMKARFAGNVDLNRLIDYKIISDNSKIVIKDDVTIQRLKKNVYEVCHRDESYKIDLNLAESEVYKPPYQLPKVEPPKVKFAVINTGTGDGWNHQQPCFGSMICHDSKYYLLDCEVFCQESMACLGLKINDLAGIFMSHAHDDHMSGLPIIYNAKIQVKIFATKLVYHSLMHKITNLLNISKKDFQEIFIHQELEYEKWNNINGMEVIPLHSAHPIETSIFFFRVADGNDYKTYAHLGDIAPIAVIKKFREAAITQSEKDFYTNMIKNYQAPVDLKKVDIGGGLIHGLVEDFANDSSKKIILGHYHRRLTAKELRIGKEQSFGDYDILIP